MLRHKEELLGNKVKIGDRGFYYVSSVSVTQISHTQTGIIGYIKEIMSYAFSVLFLFLSSLLNLSYCVL